MDRVQAVARTNQGGQTTDDTSASSQRQNREGLQAWLYRHLNFFRIYLLVFTFIPLFFSVIFWAVNGGYKVKYVDALYLAYSSFTSTGLSPIDLSHTTPLQQVIMFLLMFSGSSISVSWVTVMVRKNTLATQCAHYLAEQRGFRAVTRAAITAVFPRFLSKSGQEVINADLEEGETHTLNFNQNRSNTIGSLVPFRGLNIRRVETTLQKVDPSGHISRAVTDKSPPKIFHQPADEEATSPPLLIESPRPTSEQLHDEKQSTHDAKMDDNHPVGLPRPSPLSRHIEASGLGLTTVSSTPAGSPGASPRTVGFDIPATTTIPSAVNGSPRADTLRQRRPISTGRMPPRDFTYTEIDIRLKRSTTRRKESFYLPNVDERFVSEQSIGFGGFPGPITILQMIYQWILSKIPEKRRLRPYPSRLLPVGTSPSGELSRYATKEIPYFSFSAIVGKNSTFHGLTRAELNELGGVEYRALRLLSYLVPTIYICIQALGWLVNGIIFSEQKYHSLFTGQWKYVHPAWAGVFQATSVTTNSGMSLVDTGLVAFQREPGVLIVASFESLAGNTAFPILIRFIIWIGTKLFSRTSQTWATLHFLLDHPRRCFLYLFPSHQTWFLFFVLFILNMIDWSGFLLLDLGNQALDQLPLKWRVINGLLQATSVRCAGIASVSLSSLAPASQVLFVIMMYIAPYPIALAVRSTNVYQDRSLGIYEDDGDDESEQEDKYEHDRRARPLVWASYLGWHARRQLSYDIWWIAGAWLLIAIFERAKIWNPSTEQFDLFGILFELVSAYGSVGLSLGLSTENYSLSGAWTPASKVTLCIVMIRGRSRGLPVAIDRAVMLPTEFGGFTDSQPSPNPVVPTEELTNGSENSEKQPSPPP